jgi:6,7-dimethyl-8-ribityllumazine synthase
MALAQIKGETMGVNKKFAVVVSSSGSSGTEQLMNSAISCLLQHGATEENIIAVRVPGIGELPLAAKKLAESEWYDAVICLGDIIRDGSSNFDSEGSEVSKEIASIAFSTDKPVSFGILTEDTVEQAVNQAEKKEGNKGWYAALRVLEMVDLLEKIDDHVKSRQNEYILH